MNDEDILQDNEETDAPATGMHVVKSDEDFVDEDEKETAEAEKAEDDIEDGDAEVSDAAEEDSIKEPSGDYEDFEE